MTGSKPVYAVDAQNMCIFQSTGFLAAEVWKEWKQLHNFLEDNSIRKSL